MKKIHGPPGEGRDTDNSDLSAACCLMTEKKAPHSSRASMTSSWWREKTVRALALSPWIKSHYFSGGVGEEPLNLHHSCPLPLMWLCLSLYKSGIYKTGASNRLRINSKVSGEGRKEGWQAQNHYHSVKGLCSASVWQLFSLLQPRASEL